MSYQRWRRIEDICHDALERLPDHRAAFVREACAGDEALRAEVDSLLANASRAPDSGLGIGDLGLGLIGKQIGVYRIVSLLGAGGMGEVYRARDSKLERDVAIKVLPGALTSDADRLARFQREARVLASLNHAHIAAIYGVEDTAGVPALVLELVEGETLAERLAKGPLAPAGALNVARQIADALDAAHEVGVIHRDLKPANIKITPAGTVKVLDFGLAKVTEASASGLLTSGLSHEGLILGTAAYMSPEQARGLAVDKRTDIWAFGCVLYEMLTGRQAFAGTTPSDTIAAILDREPDWAALAASTPAAVRNLMQRCFEKDPKRRLRDIGDVPFALDDLLVPSASSPPVRRPLWKRVLPAIALTAVAGALTGTAVWYLKPAPPLKVMRATYVLPDGQRFTNPGRQIVAISPDGTQIVYVANLRLYLKSMDAVEGVEIAGTRSMSGVTSPVFSPDGQSVAYWENTGRGAGSGVLKKIAMSGGASFTLCPANIPHGMTWDESGILFGASGAGVMRVPAHGGTPELIVPVEMHEIAHRPQLLPDRRSVLYTLGRRTPTASVSWDDAQVVVQAVGSNERKVIVDKGSDARYLSSGHILFANGQTVLAMPFDPGRLEATAVAVPVLAGVSRAASGLTGTAQFSVSATGSLIYLSGTIGNATSPFERALVWVDRTGREEFVPAPRHGYLYPRLSPDESRVALDALDAQRDVWIWEFARSILTKLTLHEAADKYPVWTPNGRQIVFASDRGGHGALFRVAADGTGQIEPLAINGRESGNELDPLAFSPDGTRLLFRELDPKTAFDLHMLTPEKPAGSWRKTPLLRSGFSENNGVISPDGRWMAYESDESGRYEVYVRPFPNVDDERWQISTGGGTRPVWTRSGGELLYLKGGGGPYTPVAMMSVVVQRGAKPAFSPPQLLFEGTYFVPLTEVSGFTGRTYDAAADGSRFLMIKWAYESDASSAQPPLVIVANWFKELEKIVPSRR